MHSFLNRKIRNPYFVLSGFIFFYLLVPAIMLDVTSTSYNWNFGQWSINAARITAFAYFIFFAFLACITKPVTFDVSNIYLRLRKSTINLTLYAMVFFLGLWILLNFGEMSTKLLNEGYTGKDVSDTSLFKTVAYLILPISVVLQSSKGEGRILLYIAAFMLCVIDILSGTRTIAYLALAAILIPKMLTSNNASLILPLFLLCTLYFIVLFFRVDHAQEIDAPAFVRNLGEFRETFNGFVYILDSHFYPTQDFFNILEVMGVGLLGPLRFFLDPTIPGAEVMAFIGRGYGLGLLIALEGYYYFGLIGVVIWPLILVCFVEFLKSYIFKIRIFGFVEYVLFCTIARLFIREGIVVYIPFFIYLSAIYFIIILIINPPTFNNNYFISNAGS